MAVRAQVRPGWKREKMIPRLLRHPGEESAQRVRARLPSRVLVSADAEEFDRPVRTINSARSSYGVACGRAKDDGQDIDGQDDENDESHHTVDATQSTIRLSTTFPCPVSAGTDATEDR
jgi:hypothetical protein